MHKIYKYHLTEEVTIISVTENTIVLTADVQYDIVNVWMQLQDTDIAGAISYEFLLVATGETIDITDYIYLNTCLLRGGTFVLHVYYKKVS